MKSLLFRGAPQFCKSLQKIKTSPCSIDPFRIFSCRPIGSESRTSAASSQEYKAYDVVSNEQPPNPEPSSAAISSNISMQRERTYAQKIRDEFLERERKRLPGILRKVEKSLAEPEQDKYGEFRGLVIFRERSMPRGASIKSAKRQLSALISKRHALRHGFHRLTHMRKNNELGKSILGHETDQVLNVPQARIILNQFWCFGRSKMYEHLKREEDLRRQNRQKQGLEQHTIGNGTLLSSIGSRTKIDIRPHIVEDFARELRRRVPELKVIDEEGGEESVYPKYSSD